MSDPLEDEGLTKLVCAALFDDCFVNKGTLERTRQLLGKLGAAGYRIVKPDAEWADFSAYVPGDDDLPGYRAAHADGDREFAIETILQDSDETHDLFETITVPVSRASLLAELESMKEAGE